MRYLVLYGCRENRSYLNRYPRASIGGKWSGIDPSPSPSSSKYLAGGGGEMGAFIRFTGNPAIRCAKKQD